MKNVNPDYEIVGFSAAIKKVLQQIDELAPFDDTVLITGEPGTGKELAAHRIHRKSKRARRPFYAESCSRLTMELADSELFGHVRGAFTTAIKDRAGWFETADRSTLFLDEIESLPPDIQAKFLRVLVDGVVRRAGGTKAITTDVRIIAATNTELRENPRFRHDLYYRLDVTRIDTPPLRDRPEDIGPIASFYLGRLNLSYKRKKTLTAEALSLLEGYAFPGNVWELQNIVLSAYIRSPTDEISYELVEEIMKEKRLNIVRRASDHVSADAAEAYQGTWAEAKKRLSEQIFEQMLVASLKRHGGNKTAAVRELGINYKTMYYKIYARYGSMEEFYDAHDIPKTYLRVKRA